jgi:EamA domain-containing membrane protein RarD
MNSIDIIGILTWSLTVVNLVFAVVVLFNNPKKSTNISYAFVIVSLALWSIATYFYNNPILFSLISGYK